MLRMYIETIRPKQWIKNLVIFAGVVFDRQLLLPEPVFRVFLAALIFCLISGLTYTINDLIDLESDKLHPQKRFRPIASGRLSKNQATIFFLVLALISLPAAFILSLYFGLVCASYTVLMILYSKWLKQIMLVDVFIIALGFVLRVIAGLVVIKVNFFSPWLFVLTTLLALFLGFGKRFSELRLLESQASEHRKVLEGYTIPLLNQYLVVILSSILITYSLYTFSAHPSGEHYVMMLTIPFVFYGLFRYMYIIQSSNLAAAPEEVLLNDTPLKVTIALWAVSAMIILYLIP